MSIKSIIEEETSKIAFGTDMRGRRYIDVADLKNKIPEIEKKIIDELSSLIANKANGENDYLRKSGMYEAHDIIKNLTS